MKRLIVAAVGTTVIAGTVLLSRIPTRRVNAQALPAATIDCSSGTCTLNPALLYNYIQLTRNVTSLTTPAGPFGARPLHLTICQGAGGPFTISGIGANISGDTSLGTAGCSYYRMIWDENTQTWVTTRIGLPIVTKASQLIDDTPVFSGTVSIPATLVSLGTVPTQITNSAILANTFYNCAMNTTNATAQANLSIAANVPTAGTLMVITRNESASILGSAYTINFQCKRQ